MDNTSHDSLPQNTNAITCRFCGLTKKTVRSHIIPDFMFRDLKDKDGTIMRLNLDETDSRLVRKMDFTDSNLLCTECDNAIFGRWEGVAARFLNYEIYPRIRNTDRQFWVKEEHRETLTGVNYSQLKLFILSVIWRAHHSEQTLFRHVNIGILEPVIKQMLKDGNPGEQELFEFSMIGIIDVTGNPLPLIMEPTVLMDANAHICRFLMGGIMYIVNLGLTGFEHFERFSTKVNGEQLFCSLSGMRANQMLKALKVPEDQADWFTFRIYRSKGGIVAMAKKGHFDVLINFCSCDGERKGVCKEIADNLGFGESDSGADQNTAKLPELRSTTFHLNLTMPQGIKNRKEMIIVDAYVKKDSRNNRPFDRNAFIHCLKAINERYPGKTVGMTKQWKGFVSWDLDQAKIISIIENEMSNCHVHIVEEILQS